MMHVICLTPLAPGVYNDHKADHITAPPEGWAVILREGDPVPVEWAGKEIDYSLPSTFPRLGSIEAEELTYTREVSVLGEDGMPTFDEGVVPVLTTEKYTMMTVTSMTEGTLPEAPALTPTEQRENAYNTSKIIPWEDSTITVTEAAQKWQYYAAEGNIKAYDLQSLIAKAKAEIRSQYPEVST